MCKENKAGKLIKFLRDNYSEDDESMDNLLSGLNILKNNTEFKGVKQDSLDELLELLDYVQELSIKAILIEIIVEIKCFKFNKNRNLLNEYINLIEEKYISNEKASKYLNIFISLGTDAYDIFNIISKKLDEETAIKILIDLNIELDTWKIVFRKKKKLFSDFDKTNRINEDFYKNFEQARRIKDRSFVILSFLSIAHPQIKKYWGSITFFSYYSNEGNDFDFIWEKPAVLEKLIENKVISVQEADIIKCACNYDYNHIKKDILNTKKLREDMLNTNKLYKKFFADQDPLDVIFTLPK